MRWATAVLVACVLTSCAAPAGTETVTVFAAASLSPAFSEIGRKLGANDGIRTRFNFLSSGELATQIENGAPADVFAPADLLSMDRLRRAGILSEEPRIFATNRMTIVVPAGNPADIRGIEDLADDELVLALCNEICPAGRYAEQVLAAAGIVVHPDSLEGDVKAVVNRVLLGEADAGIVYVSDVVAAGRHVEEVSIPDELNTVVPYPVTVLDRSSTGARGFLALLTSPAGRRILVRYGFGVP